VGGPEEVSVGPGLVLTDGTLVTAEGLLNTFGSTGTLSPGDSLIIRRQGHLYTVPASAMRSLYSAGEHVTIDGQGTITAVWPSDGLVGETQSGDIGILPRSQSLQASDLIPIQRGGVSQATSYSTLLNAQTIDQAALADIASDSDVLWVSQSSDLMVRQSFSAIWSWVNEKLPTHRLPCVEIESDITLDYTVHNGRVLVCTQPVQIMAVEQNMGAGFHCEIINLGPAPVTFGPGVLTSSGSSTLLARRSAQVRVLSISSGNVVYASIASAATSASVPGPIQDLAIVDVLATSVGLLWAEPSVGAPPFTYSILYRVVGATAWLPGPAGLGITAGTVYSLNPGISHEFAVIASNAAGSGTISSIVNATTQGLAAAPGQPFGVVASTQGPNSISLSWTAPTSGGAVRDYSVQYRSSGSTVWSNGPAGVVVTSVIVPGLAASTTYEFRVFSVNEGGNGPASTVVSATTQPLAGIVSAIQWNMVPTGPYTRGGGAIGVNVLVTPPDGAVRLGFSTSASTPPASWTLAIHVMTNLWGAYVDTPATAGTWYAWAQGTDGSATTVYSTPFVVQ